MDRSTTLDASPFAAGLLRDGVPEWDAIDFDVLCSRCGYNLRTLTTPRCTECGLTFEWKEVVHQAGWRSDFLFEHNWRKRPIASLFDTIWRARNPWRFWRSVSIHDRVYVRPLVFMLLFSTVVLMASLSLLAAWLFIPLDWLLESQQTTTYPPHGGIAKSAPYWIERLVGVMLSIARGPLENQDVWIWECLIAGYLTLMLAFIMAMRQTLGRCRIRISQVLRLVAYSACPIAMWASVAIIAMTCTAFYLSGDGIVNIPITTYSYHWLLSYNASIAFMVMSIGCFAPIPIAYVSVGLREYLRLRHARTIAILGTVTSMIVLSLVAVAHALWLL